MSHGIKSKNLFHTLNQRYGQSLIKEVRSLEGKEHKLVRFKQHRGFNLRCLKENVVPKSVKLNFKQFKQLNECKILCKTHHQILNSRDRKTNRTIDKISKDICDVCPGLGKTQGYKAHQKCLLTRRLSCQLNRLNYSPTEGGGGVWALRSSPG